MSPLSQGYVCDNEVVTSAPLRTSLFSIYTIFYLHITAKTIVFLGGSRRLHNSQRHMLQQLMCGNVNNTDECNTEHMCMLYTTTCNNRDVLTHFTDVYEQHAGDARYTSHMCVTHMHATC